MAGQPGGVTVRQVRVLKGQHEGGLLAVRYNADGRYCLTCGKDRSIRLWNPSTGLHIKAYMAHGRQVRDVAVTSDNARLASCGAERSVLLWDVASGRVLRRMRGHDNEVNSVKFNDLDTVIVSGGYDRSVKVWDCRSNSVDAIQVMDPFDDAVMSVAVVSHCIIAAGVDGAICTFDVRMGRLVRDDLGPDNSVNCVSVTRDGNCVLASCLHSVVRLLDRDTGELLNEYTGHVNEEYKVESCVSYDDAWAISGSEDGRVCVWDLVEATRVADVDAAHSGAVTGMAYHPNEHMLLSCSTDGTCTLWQLQPQQQ